MQPHQATPFSYHGARSRRPLEGFEREAQAQARIEHANICKIYEVGEVEGQPYIAMQLIVGSSLQALMGVMSKEEKERALAQVASALHAAHKEGLIHRDIKPTNLMAERNDGGAYTPYLLDFGLAREVGANVQSSTGGLEGTPAFMAREQARGENRQLDCRTDVYGLGAALHLLLTGRVPFLGSTTDVLLDIMFNEPPRLRQIDPAIPSGLETITLKCLEKEPGKRYPTAQALADGLMRHLEGRRIAARPPGAFQRIGRFTRRNKLLVALASTVFLATLALAVVVIRERIQAATQARLAQGLGQDIKEIELFMRAAYSLPVHEIEREQRVVRARMARLEEKGKRADARSRAALDYAQGRGHLALREYEQAQAMLAFAPVPARLLWLAMYLPLIIASDAGRSSQRQRVVDAPADAPAGALRIIAAAAGVRLRCQLAALCGDPGARLLLSGKEGDWHRAAGHQADGVHRQPDQDASRGRAAEAGVAAYPMNAGPLPTNAPRLCWHRIELGDVDESEIVPMGSDDLLGKLQDRPQIGRQEDTAQL